MQRIRKQNGMAQIVVRIEKECPVDEVPTMLDNIHDEIEEASARLVQNIPHFDEVRIDKHGDMSTKKKREIAEPPEKEGK